MPSLVLDGMTGTQPERRMTAEDLQLAAPSLNADRRMYCLSTEDKPTSSVFGSLEVGDELQETDTGRWFYWTGSAWARTTFLQKLDQLVELNIEIRNLLRNASA